MQIKAATVEEYISSLPEDRKIVMNKLRESIKASLPAGFVETMSYGMISYVVPHLLYPPGYHCDPKLPLQFMSIASQKNFVAVYHMGIYFNLVLLDWFTAEYPKHCKTRLDMGKSCIRFKKPEQLPFSLIGELSAKISPDEWIRTYESRLRK